MRVLNVNKFYRLVGGSERYYFDLANLLTSRGHQVIPFSMLYSHNRETPYNKYFVSYLDYNQISLRNILRLGPKIVGKMVYSLESKRQIEKLIKDTKPDIAHIHMIDHQISPSILDSLKKLGIPMVQTLHEYKLICPNYRLYIERKRDLREMQRRKVLQYSRSQMSERLDARKFSGQLCYVCSQNAESL